MTSFISCIDRKNTTLISPSDGRIQYMGRVDDADSASYLLAYPGVTITTRFKGDYLAAVLDNYGAMESCFYVWVDDQEPVKIAVEPGKRVYPLVSEVSEGEHSLRLMKLTEAEVGVVSFEGFLLDESELLEPELTDSSALKLEFIGNSITCGYGNEMCDSIPRTGFRPLEENVYKAWGMDAARMLNAQCVCTSFSGRGLVHNFDGATEGTLPLIYERSNPMNPESRWETGRYVPDIVVVNLGTNDFSAESFSGVAVDSVVFVNNYVSFLARLRGYYPEARFVCAVGVMTNDGEDGLQSWTRLQSYVSTAVEEFKKSGASAYFLALEPQTAPYGADWHPTEQTHQRMAQTLVDFLREEAIVKE